MIEVLPNVFYDPSKEWYEQDPQLIELALQVEQTAPIDSASEKCESRQEQTRLLFAVWNHTTEMGNFQMRVDIIYLYDVCNNAFMTKAKHNKVTITKLQ